MDQIAVADIPLPDEELDFKTEIESHNQVNDNISNSGEIISSIKSTEEENCTQEIEMTSSAIKNNEGDSEISELNDTNQTVDENQTENKNQDVVVETVESTVLEMENKNEEKTNQIVESEKENITVKSDTDTKELKISVTVGAEETEMINLVVEDEGQLTKTKQQTQEGKNQLIKTETDSREQEQEMLTTVNEAETEFLSKIISEDTENIKLECVTNEIVSETVEELEMEVEQALIQEPEKDKLVSETEESRNKSELLEQVTDEDVTMESLKLDETNEDIEQPMEINEISDTGDDKNDKDSSPIVEEIINEEKIEPKKTETPAKVTRSNSTIEAIKNDWADSLTIEEMNEEMTETTVSSSSPKPEPIITEPENHEESSSADKPDELQNKNDVNVTKIVVADAEDEDIIATVRDDVIIEIIDNKVIEEISAAEEQSIEPVKDEIKDNSVKIKDEIVNNNETSENSSTEINKTPGKQIKTRGVRSSQRLTTRDGRLQIPCHVLGRNVENPTEDLTSNGRTPPKPRLGVKVPYRFLTSQIVTKEEIANELMQLTTKRNPDRDPPAGGDIFFASKLTQRLASKIALNANKKKPQSTDKINESTSGIPSEALNTPPTIASGSKNDQIADNSDLLAILEGNVDVDLSKELRNTKTSEREVKIDSRPDIHRSKKLNPELERELALKQLREMPPKKDARGRPRKYRIFESKSQYTPVKETPKPKEISKPVIEIIKIKKESEQTVQPVTKVLDSTTNENIKQAASKIAKKLKENEKLVLKEDKNKQTNDLDLENDIPEPNLTPKRVTKTYSRKEAVLNVPDDLELIVNETESLSALNELADDVNKKETSEVTIIKASDLKHNKQKNPDETVQKKNEQNKTPRKSKRTSTEINKPEVTLISKRARIIKRKVIWDPAEVPKTKVLNAIRRAQALELKVRKQQMKAKKVEEDDGSDEDGDDEDDDENETETERKTEEYKPKEIKKSEISSKTEIRTRRNKKMLPRATLKVKKAKKFIMKRQLRSLRGRNIRPANGEFKSSLVLSRKKIAEMAKSVKPKKTELDRLLGDEGAVNMLYSVRQTNVRGKAQKSVSQKELLNRTKVIRDVIMTQSNSNEDTSKALRKKESPTLAPIQIPPRKKSRDSIRSSLQSPPPSPSYFHPQRAEASRIIRRHSSSFSSDCSSPRRLSIDQQATEIKHESVEDSTKTDFQSPIRILRRKCIIVDKKPEDLTKDKKKSEENENKTEKEKLTVAEKRKLNIEMSKVFEKTPKKRTRSSKGDEDEPKEDSNKVDKNKSLEMTDKDEKETTEIKTKPRIVTVQSDYKEIQLKKTNYFYQIVMFSSAGSKHKSTINVQIFQELTAVLTKLAKDDACRVVALTSNGAFCNGIDYSNLIQISAEKRLSVAQDLAKHLKDFIQTLARFPKPIIASVQGSAKFLGCTILPYFDVILLSDSANLGTPYYRLGQSPEGAPGLTLSRNVFTDLLMFGKKFSAQEAFEKGLVTKLEKIESLAEATLKIGNELAEKSPQFMVAAKSLLRQPILQKLDEALEVEQKLLIEHWTSSECQQNFKKLLQEEELW